MCMSTGACVYLHVHVCAPYAWIIAFVVHKKTFQPPKSKLFEVTEIWAACVIVCVKVHVWVHVYVSILYMCFWACVLHMKKFSHLSVQVLKLSQNPKYEDKQKFHM